jgi:excinuclease UvrABC nuclease subunit
MPVPSELFPFTARLIAGSPEEPGIYVLWEDGDVIYIGHAQGRGITIRSRLVDHFAGTLSPCTRRASHYSWEISLKPAPREQELIEEYRRANTRLPRCNAAA